MKNRPERPGRDDFESNTSTGTVKVQIAGEIDFESTQTYLAPTYIFAIQDKNRDFFFDFRNALVDGTYSLTGKYPIGINEVYCDYYSKLCDPAGHYYYPIPRLGRITLKFKNDRQQVSGTFELEAQRRDSCDSVNMSGKFDVERLSRK